MSTADRPWLAFYGHVPPHVEYPRITLYEAIVATAARTPDAVALEFFGARTTYRALVDAIDRAAAALASLGLRAGERLLISLPTTPAGVIAFYAANKLGVVPALIHPLSAPPEIQHYLDATGARVALTLDAFHGVFARLEPKRPLDAIVLSRIGDDLSFWKRAAFWLTKGRKIPRVPDDARVRWWRDLLRQSHGSVPRAATTTDDDAAILFSGGTTGLPKGIVLTNRNFIAEGMQAATWVGMTSADSILAILPLFHGFGLGVCVNAALMVGGRSILVPQFSAPIVARLLRSARPNLLVGVPTLFDALARDASLARADLSCLRACFCGADTLPRPVKERFEALVAARGGRVRLLEGYGLTEAVTGIMAMPLDTYREGSIGLPFPDMDARICRYGTTEEMPVGEEGEICLAGPALMRGYLNDPEATAQTLRLHADGRTWLHTGDLGRRDQDGFFYFVVRAKRMIKSSGFNVYPAQVEAVLLRHPLVAEACVIGVPDPARIERVKAIVVLNDPTQESEATTHALMAHCRHELIKWSCPRDIDFRRELPRTRVGKIDFMALVREERARSATPS